jgi:hypothetical protein
MDMTPNEGFKMEQDRDPVEQMQSRRPEQTPFVDTRTQEEKDRDDAFIRGHMGMDR